MSAPGGSGGEPTALAHRLRPAASDPQGALVLLHGRGTDENDLYPVLDMLDPQQRLHGVTVRAPLSLPPGGRHWYAIQSVGHPDPATFSETYSLLDATLRSLLGDLGVPAGRTVLGGFSQGTVMSYAMGLGADRPRPAAILALSGFIPTVPGLQLDLESRRGLPVLIAHGSMDPVIGVQLGRDAHDRLSAAGLDVTYRESAMGHSIDPRLLPEMQTWLSDVVSRAVSPTTPTTSSPAAGAA